MNEKTVFEKVIARELPGTFLYEDDNYAIIDNINPVAPIHYLVIPKVAVPAIALLPEEQAHIPGELIRIANKFMKKEGIENFKLVFNGGKYLHLPDHLHLHLLAGDELED